MFVCFRWGEKREKGDGDEEGMDEPPLDAVRLSPARMNEGVLAALEREAKTKAKAKARGRRMAARLAYQQKNNQTKPITDVSIRYRTLSPFLASRNRMNKRLAI